ncbi:hypothetical protein [Streptomyces sp. RPT161]|nr:hypothetical protein [Streptomyces sp. RPT161]
MANRWGVEVHTFWEQVRQSSRNFDATEDLGVEASTSAHGAAQPHPQRR